MAMERPKGPRPVVAIVGRPNVGKSTLFNRILGRRKALVAGQAGVTRDLNFADTEELGRPFTLVDTGGFTTGGGDIEEEIRLQVRSAVEEADAIIFLMDGRTGLAPGDMEIADLLRRSGRPVFYAVNKIDSPAREKDVAEFYRLGVEKIFPVSAEHGLGVNELIDAVAEALPPATAAPEEAGMIRVAIVGRPNVGKSTLLNKLIGKKRAVVSGVPGTTLDATDTPFERDGRRYLFIDTAGIRKKNRVAHWVEAYAVMEAIRSIEKAHVAVLVLDATAGITAQDMRIAGIIDEKKRCVVIAVNKWDILEKDEKTVDAVTAAIRQRMPFLGRAPILFVSALRGQRVEKIFEAVDELYAEASREVPTSRLNAALKEVLARKAPGLYRGRPVKFFYAVQTGVLPPAFIIFTNYPEAVGEPYRRFLASGLARALGLEHVPLRVRLRKRRG